MQAGHARLRLGCIVGGRVGGVAGMLLLMATVALTSDDGTSGDSSVGLPEQTMEPTAGQGRSPAAATWTVATPSGAGSDVVRHVVTATGVNQRGMPIHAATGFPVQTPVYVTFTVRGLARGEPHRLSVRWYLHDTLVAVAGAHTSTLVTHDGPGFFSLTYPAPGTAQARLSWDEPISDTSDTANDQYLAQMVAFTIQ